MGYERQPAAAAEAARPSWEAVLLAIVLAGVAGLLFRGYESHQPIDLQQRQERHHADTLANREADPYQYKYFATAWAIELVHRTTAMPLRSVYRWNLLLSLFVVLLAHVAWLRAWLPRSAAVGGTFLLAAYAHLLFLQHYHYPNEFWGVAGLCLVLRLEWRRAGVLAACVAALLTGLVWEKHVLVPFAFLAWRWFREGRAASVLRFLAVTTAAALPQVLLRVLLGEDRPLVDVTPFAAVDWGLTFQVHGLFLVPPLIVLLAGWMRVPSPLRWLWLCVPAMFAIYVAQQRMLQEARSYWIFVPIFCGTIASVLLVGTPADARQERESTV